MIQGILAPYQSVVTSDDRLSLLPLAMKQLVITNRNKFARFQFQPFVVNPRTIPDYQDWWKSVFDKAFPSPSDHYLSKLIGGSHGKPSQPPRPAIIKVAL